MYQRILVPIDGSATSNKALVAALQMARESGGRVRLIHVVEELAYLSGYAHEALALRPGFALIGIGMWLALIMAANVWFIIWPNQKRALGIVEADDASKAKSTRTAMLASRANTLLSIPMLYAMASFQSLGS